MNLGNASMPQSALVVEDDSGIAYLMKFLLEKEGYAVEVVSNGDLARERIHGAEGAGPVDLVVLDIMLPGTNGLILLEELRNLPEWDACPVIMLSAKSDESAMTRASTLGASDYVSKPFDPIEFLTRVRRLRAQQDNQRAVAASAASPADSVAAGRQGGR